MQTKLMSEATWLQKWTTSPWEGYMINKQHK